MDNVSIQVVNNKALITIDLKGKSVGSSRRGTPIQVRSQGWIVIGTDGNGREFRLSPFTVVSAKKRS